MASAGSGKTYALAKNYILNLIAFKNNSNKWQLRKSYQLEDSLSHLLAITFTNKATNEMKQRIVNNLALLSEAGKRFLNHEETKKIPYLNEFQSLLDCSISDIGKISEAALKTILNNYSQFKISTIDSFFQEILRNFTYEANISESYKLEMDSVFVAESALDLAIHELDTHPHKMGNAAFWLNEIIEEEATKSQRWNLFDKKATSHSVYQKIQVALLQLENENYKQVKDFLDKYFDEKEKRKLVELYKDFKKAAIEERKILLETIHDLALKTEKILYEESFPLDQLQKNFIDHIKKAKELKFSELFEPKFKTIENNNSVFLKKYIKEENFLDKVALQMYSAIKQWNMPQASSLFKNWILFGEMIPYLGVILEVRSFINNLLERDNIIQLSDTNYILRKVIGNEDTPFVYERIGNRIDQYMIDEFQDTSRMQWDIIYPLINENESKGQDTLIIGDPKQSIYRFRNADHTLISEEVPHAFSSVNLSGLTPKENTNWRSHTRIVEFNNYFFKVLSNIISTISEENGIPTNFKKLYSNVIQTPSNKGKKGYIEIRFIEKSPVDNESDELNYDMELENSTANNEEPKDWFASKALSEVGPLISSLIYRGYHQEDIGILVNTNNKGKQVVEYLIKYNENLPEGTKKIDFISEESLLVSSSSAVEIILGVLKKLTQPSFIKKTTKINNSEEKEYKSLKRPYYKWNNLKESFNIFSLQHSDISPAKRIMRFLEETDNDIALVELISTLPTPSLSSIVEATSNLFLDDELREIDALYISSFQDIVNEYCANHPNDPASFLEWWNSRGKDKSISAPNEIDAVQIMTIHKSKGLEFKCVIIPFATDSFIPENDKNEWRWINTIPINGVNLPPVLPLKTNTKLFDSYYADIYRKYYDQILTDKLNMYYVAFTRAKNELYIFTKKPKKNNKTLSSYLYNIISEISKYDSDFDCTEKKFILDHKQLNFSKDENLITYGEPFIRDDIDNEYKNVSNNEDLHPSYFKDYYVNKTRPRLKSVASKVSPSGEFLQV